MGVLKTRAEAKTNFDAAIGSIPARYEAGIKKADWATAAGSDEAQANWIAKITDATIQARRQDNIRKVSNTTWQSKAISKGKAIIGTRIREALGDWDAKWGPMYDAVAETVRGLAPKGIDWEANVDTRLKAVVRKWKEVSGKS